MSEARLSLSIVHHDGREMLQNCLHSLRENPPSMPYEIVLVDNVSTDGAREMLRQEFPEVRLLENEQRAGFGANHNRAMTVCRGEYILLLNDDTLVHPGAIDALYAHLDAHREAALVGPRLLNADGSLQKSCYKFPSPLRCVWENLLLTAAFPTHPIFGDYRAWAHDTERQVDFVSGAAMLVRRLVVEQIGGFDTSFFMYAEETDWQKRMTAAGHTIRFTPDAVLTHLGGASSEGMRDRQFCEFHRSQARFIRKHYGLAGAVLQRGAMVFGAMFRLLLWTLLYPAKRAAARHNLRLWTRLLKWWSGFGPHEGIAELAAHTGK